MFKKTAFAAAAVIGALAFASAASAAEYKVQVLNKAAEGPMGFSTPALKLKVGDSIRFVPTDPGHNVESIPTMLPPGAAPFKGAMSKEVVVVFSKPGVYGIKCLPHYAMGMVMVVVVGDPSPNLAAAKAAADKTPPFARKRLAADFVKLKL